MLFRSLEIRPIPVTQVVTDGWQPLEDARVALRDLVQFGQGLISFVITLIIWTPVWLPIYFIVRYVRQRRHVATHHVQTATIANKQAMEQKDPVKRQQYRDDMRRRASDEDLARQFLMRTSLIESLRDAAQVE